MTFGQKCPIAVCSTANGNTSQRAISDCYEELLYILLKQTRRRERSLCLVFVHYIFYYGTVTSVKRMKRSHISAFVRGDIVQIADPSHLWIKELENYPLMLFSSDTYQIRQVCYRHTSRQLSSIQDLFPVCQEGNSEAIQHQLY